FALLLGGVLGNLTDRLTRPPGFPVGHVIDFISTPWMIPAIYNVADIAIVSGMILFVLISLLGLPIDGGPRSRRTPSDEAPAAPAAPSETEH
ncbi:MAG: signal peptidase II, partial [Actinobacteria bacterium]|nr:signal peptidase II [Actinomycetota bacterium]